MGNIISNKKNGLSYPEFVVSLISDKKTAEPIYVRNLAADLARETGMGMRKASAAIAVAIKRLLQSRRCPNLRMWKKGIYYKTALTPFGETGIDLASVLHDRYLADNNGYETGYGLLYRMGLTTQIPANRSFATNALKAGTRDEMGMRFRPAKITVTVKTKPYLQVLDAMALMDKAPVDAEDPYLILAGFIAAKKLDFSILLDMANRLYNEKTVKRLAVVAGKKIE